ncbi:flagellar basal body-associated FliL family protein [Acidihalobacter ferrooxydans]|nr:flagellar basal body-associated protein FliL [Acidihalobacter ferrooxydans]
MKLIIIASVAAVVLLIAAVGATLFLTGALNKKSASAATHETAPPLKPPVYFSITPPLVVNFQHPTQARFLQVGIDVMARDPHVIEELKTNMPAIRNRLIILLSAQSYNELSTPAGKEKLRKEVLDSINTELKKAGVHGHVDNVYFTNFVMQ